jgi:hypothetical protein
MRWVRLAGAVASVGLGIWAPPSRGGIAEIVRFFVRTFPAPRPLFAMQMYGKLRPASLTEVESPPEPVGNRSELRVYAAVNIAGKTTACSLAPKIVDIDMSTDPNPSTPTGT